MFLQQMFFFSKENITSKGDSEIQKEIERKKKEDIEQSKRVYEKIKKKMNTKEQFQNDFQNEVNKYPVEQRKYFNALYELKDFLDDSQKTDPQTLPQIKSLALYTRYLIMNNADYKKLIHYLHMFTELKVLWLTISVATCGEDRLNCDESSLEELRKAILEIFGSKLDALYVKFNYDAHDSQWNNKKKTIHTINEQWDETFEKIIPLYRCDYQFCGLLI